MPVLGIDASRAVKKEKTGVEWYSYFLLRAMEKCTPPEWSVRLYMRAGDVKWDFGNDYWQWKELTWIGRGWTQGRLSLEMMKSPSDVLFVPSHIVPLVHPVHTITTVHDVIYLSRPELYEPGDLAAQKRGLEFALNFAKKIIVPTKAVRDDLLRAGAKGDQVVVVPHGVEWPVEVSVSQPVSSGGVGDETVRPHRYGQPNPRPINTPFILFIGRIEKKKNVLGLIHAFRNLIHNLSQHPSPGLRPPSPAGRGEGEGQLKLILAGSLGYGGDDVLQAIKTFKLEECVVHFGYVDRAQYHALLQDAAVMVVPSFGEGFGLPVLEAMAAGTPVVCSDLSVLHEVGGNAVQYVNPNDPEDIARGIAAVLQNEMLQSEMVRCGKERAVQYSWEKAAKETWDVITSV